MNQNDKVTIEWENITLNDLDHYPESFVYCFIKQGSREPIYIGSAFMESPKSELPRKLSRLGLKFQNLQMIVGYLDTISSYPHISETNLNKVHKFLLCKYQPMLNKKISIDDIDKDYVNINGDNLLRIASKRLERNAIR